MITIKDLKNQVLERLNAVNGYNFALFEELGEFQEAFREGNTVSDKINCLFYVPESEVEPLSAGLYAFAYSANVDFLFPIDDRADYEGNYPNVQAFRTALSLALQEALKIEFTAEDGKTYTGGIVYDLPVAGDRVYNPIIGDCIAYTATIALAFMENAINSRDFSLKIDGQDISYTGIKLSRNPALSVDILKSATNGEATTYAENTQFKIDLTLPALKGSNFSNACMKYILGGLPSNQCFKVNITTHDGEIVTKDMIIAGIETSIGGVTNIAYIVSLVPYTTQETIGG